jgi:CPA2 family monovalent cation:H+ antiporter-2
VIFSLLLSHGMLDSASVQIVLVSIVVSMISTPFLITNLDRICGLIFKGRIEDEALDQSTIIGGHVILCGYNSFCRIVSDKLDQSGIMHVVITNNTENFVDAKENGKTVIFGGPSDRALLENVRIHDAMSTIIAFDDFEKSAKTSASIALIDPELKVIAKVPTEKERRQRDIMNIQQQLTSVNRILKDLGQELMLLDEDERTKPLASMVIEGLDFIRMPAIRRSPLRKPCSTAVRG